jgi:hypothetical protein
MKSSIKFFFVVLSIVFLSSCVTNKECCKNTKTCVTQPQEIHSDDWYSQQTLARYLKKLPKSEFDKFVGLYFVSDEDLQKLDSLTTK